MVGEVLFYLKSTVLSTVALNLKWQCFLLGQRVKGEGGNEEEQFM